jgi:hypothetical protein
MGFRQLPTVSTSPLKRFSRVLATVLLGLQAVLWGGGPIAEAASAAESLARYSHVEDQASKACPPLHRHVDCVVCRAFNAGASGGNAPSLNAIDTDVTERPSLVDAAPAQRARSGSVGSRAPPSA